MLKESTQDVGLVNSGFNIEAEVSLLQSIDKESFIEMSSENLRGFYLEYLTQEPVLPIKVRFDPNSGVYSPKYNNASLLALTSKKERFGATYQALEKLNKAFPKAQDGSLFFFISPPGWSGFEGITYKETQIYAYEKLAAQEIKSYTIRSNLNLEQSERITALFGHSSQKTSMTDRLSEVTGSLIYVPANGVFHDHEFILSTISHTMGTDNVWTRDGKNWTLDMVREKIKNIDKLEVLDDKAEAIIAEFRLKAQMVDERQLKELLAKTIIDLSRITRGQEVKRQYSTREVQSEVVHIENIPGCNGGGFIDSPLGVRNTTEWSYDLQSYCIMCGFYKWVGPCHICEDCVAKHFREEKTLKIDKRSLTIPANPGFLFLALFVVLFTK